MTSTDILNQITNIANDLKLVHGDHYGDQLYTIATDIMKSCANNIDKFQLFIEMFQNAINDDYKNNIIISLKKKVKELEIQINILIEDSKQKDTRITSLMEDSKQKDTRITNLMEDSKQKDTRITTLENQVTELINKNHNIIIWQAYKNIEYYIIQTVTGFDHNTMETLNTNLNEFMKNEKNKCFLEAITKLIEKINIHKYKCSLAKIKRTRNNLAHLDPIEMTELLNACNTLKNTYIGIEEIYNNYQEVYDYFNSTEFDYF